MVRHYIIRICFQEKEHFSAGGNHFNLRFN